MLSTPLFNLLSQRAAWLQHKSQVATDNVAHSDIPTATRSQLKPFSELVDLKSKDPALRLDRDLKKGSIQSTTDPIMKEWEVMEISETSNEYQAITSLYKKNLNLLRQVIGRSS